MDAGEIEQHSSIMNGATKTHKHLGFTPKIQAFPEKNMSRKVAGQKGRKKSPTHTQTKTYLKDCCFFRTGTASFGSL